MQNVFRSKRKLKDLLKIKTDFGFHKFFIEYSLNQYSSLFKDNLGTVLVLGANEKEAKIFPKYSFKKIILSGIQEPSKEFRDLIKKESRMSYVKCNIEKLPFENQSFDLVFCKESLHHLPRPILGLYEMLRICKNASIFIEPNETFIGNILEKLNLASVYEKNQQGNLKFRDNFVYRWKTKEIIKILKSYYLESGWKLYLTTCWISNSPKIMKSKLKNLFIFFGWLTSLFNNGNYLNVMIIPGSNLPYD